MQKWIWCISFFDLSESSSSSNTLDFRKHELPASQISPGLILHEFPNCSSRDWRRSAATVQQSQKKKQKKKHWQHYNGFILHMTSWRSFWSWLHSEVVVQKKSLSYIFVKKKKKKLRARRWNYYIKPRHQCALTRIPACLWAEKLNLTEEFNVLEKKESYLHFYQNIRGDDRVRDSWRR